MAPGIRILEEAGVPCFSFPEPAVTALAGMALVAERFRPTDTRNPARDRCPPAPVPRSTDCGPLAPAKLGLLELAPLLTAYDIPVLTPQLAGSAEEAAAIAAHLSCPVALKIASPDISHKTDVGGVSLGVTSPTEVARIAGDMLTRVRQHRPDATIHGLMVQPMAPPGKELLLGALHDAQFGPLVVVGLGGIYVEVLRDTTARLAPLSPAEAVRMLDELRMAPLLRGVRGEPAVDQTALAVAIARFSHLAADCPELVELELNPLVAHATGVVTVDARARLVSPPSRAASSANAEREPA